MSDWEIASVTGSMNRFRSILCPVDFSPASLRALDYAVELAQQYGSSLDLLNVIKPVLLSFYMDAEMVAAEIRKQADQELRRVSTAVQTEGLRSEALMRTGDIEDEILKTAKERRSDLIVVGKHGRPAVERWFIGSVTERLLRRSVVPMLIITERKASRSKHPNFRQIVVTTDFSDGTDEAIPYAVSFCAAESTLLLLHVIPDLPAAVTLPAPGIVVSVDESKD